MAVARVSLKLCTFSRSELLGSCVLPECPIELRQGGHDYCPCRRRENHQVGSVEVRVLTCTWPKLWNGRQVTNPPAFAEFTRKSCHLKMKTDRDLARIEAAKKEEQDRMAKTNGMQAPGKAPVAVKEPDPPPVREEIPEAEVMVPAMGVTALVAPIPPAREVAPSPAPRQPVPANLAGALALAQQKCGAVKKDARNTHHGYSYASAEAVIAEAKRALADTGLALVPSEQSLERLEGGGYELVRKFLLLHVSGESLVLGCAWPVIEERGRPVDKATAISATASLSYMLRDLLLMPRVKAEEDMAGRADAKPAAKSARDLAAEREAAKATPAPVQAQAPAVPAKEQPFPPKPGNVGGGAGDGKITEEQLARLRDLREQLYEAEKPADRAAAWASTLSKRGVKAAAELTATQADSLIQAIAQKLADHDVKQAAIQSTKGG